MDNYTGTTAEASQPDMAWSSAKDAMSDVKTMADGLAELFVIMNEAAGSGVYPESDGTFFILGKVANDIADRAETADASIGTLLERFGTTEDSHKKPTMAGRLGSWGHYSPDTDADVAPTDNE